MWVRPSDFVFSPNLANDTPISESYHRSYPYGTANVNLTSCMRPFVNLVGRCTNVTSLSFSMRLIAISLYSLHPRVQEVIGSRILRALCSCYGVKLWKATHIVSSLSFLLLKTCAYTYKKDFSPSQIGLHLHKMGHCAQFIIIAMMCWFLAMARFQMEGSLTGIRIGTFFPLESPFPYLDSCSLRILQRVYLRYQCKWMTFMCIVLPSVVVWH